METKDIEHTEAYAIAKLGVAISTPKNIDGTPYVVVPKGFEVQRLDNFLVAPTRKTGTTTLRDVASFKQFVIQEGNESSRIYGTYNPPGFVAVFNDHMPKGLAGWRDHKAVFSCPLSPEWKTWSGSSKKHMSQADFAAFIEDNLPDIAQPPAADMLDISRTLEAKKTVNFASGVRLSNGQNEITYEEEISGTAGKGRLTIPEVFTIGIPVLENGARYAVDARLRYRIGEGKMVMWYELVRPHKIMEDAIKEVWTDIQNTTGLTVFNGSI